jgi:hypothetical protein
MPPPAAASNGGLVGAPYVFYSPETRLGGGVGGLWYGHPADGAFGLLKASVRYTQNEQVMASVAPELELGDLRLKLKLGFERFPDRYFGLGAHAPAVAEEGFTPVVWTAKGEGEYRLGGPWFVGGDLEVKHVRIADRASDGLVAEAPGAQGGLGLGLGAHVSYDTRDEPRGTRTGGLLRLSAMHFEGALGADRFERFQLDARRFVPLLGDHVLALRGLVELHHGDVPFHQMSMLGGGDLLRGLYRGRYRDRHLATAQVEYRMPLFWRLGLAGFVEAGTVSDGLAGLAPLEEGALKLGGGLGLRFVVNAEKRLACRLDVGRSEGHTQFYFTFDEAF